MDNEPSQGTFTYDEKEKTLVVINNAGGRKDSQKFSIAWEGGLLLMTNDDGVVKLKRQ